jgi:hypothetical protein
MATPPSFNVGGTLTAAQMNAVGLWLVKTQTVQTSPAVASVTVTGAFSADYDNYRITYEGAAGSTSGEALRLQMGSTTTGYYGNLIYTNYSGAAPASVGDNNTANWTHIGGAQNGRVTALIELESPFLSQPTTVFSAIYADSGNAGTKRGYLANTISYTSFTLIAGNTLTIAGGTIRVYGYRN